MEWKPTDGHQKQITRVVYVDDLLARVKLEDAETKWCPNPDTPEEKDEIAQSRLRER